MTQIQNNFTELFLIMHATKNLQMVPLHWSFSGERPRAQGPSCYVFFFYTSKKEHVWWAIPVHRIFKQMGRENLEKSVQEATIFVSIILHHKKQIGTVGMFFWVLAST